jgi:mono/diheme cytochrome c family protein
MRGLLQRSSILARCLFFPAILAAAQTPGKRDAGGDPAPTQELERGRTVFVLSSCHFCHGVDLTAAAMGAANLMHSPLVGRDINGNLIGPIVRSGLPNLQTAMPQYSDYTDQQIRDLAAYIHYLRQQSRYKELTAARNSAPGDATLGHKYFEADCAKCHADDLAGIAGKYNAAQLSERLLRPASAVVDHPSAGAVTHARLLENNKDEDVRNALAYLATFK